MTEEKKAIEDIKNIVTDLEDTEDGAIIALQQEEIDSLKILAELIENKQKEIEELKQEKAKLKYDLKNNYIDKNIVVKNFISKDKIKNILRKAQDYQLNYKDIALFNIIMQEIFDTIEEPKWREIK